jgi:hypothetical protein
MGFGEGFRLALAARYVTCGHLVDQPEWHDQPDLKIAARLLTRVQELLKAVV